MLKVGLTGAMASGKSSVGEVFAAMGAHVIRADDIAHDLMKPGGPVYREVARKFGDAVLNADGTVNRAKLAEAAFHSGSPKSLPRVEELNQIVHPAVIRKQEEWMAETGRRDPHAIAIVEAALILEAHLKDRFDRLVVVTCRPEQRIERWADRMKVSIEAARLEITRRMASQLPDESKIKAADYVIDNSGTPRETERQVKTIYKQLRHQVELSSHSTP